VCVCVRETVGGETGDRDRCRERVGRLTGAERDGGKRDRQRQKGESERDT